MSAEVPTDRTRRRRRLIGGLVVAALVAFAAGATIPGLLRGDVDGRPEVDPGVEDTTPDPDDDPLEDDEQPFGEDGDAPEGDGDDPDGDDADGDLALPAWIVVVQSLTFGDTSAEQADAAAQRFRDAGVDDVAVLRSDDVSGLEDGFWVVHAGGGWGPDDEDAAEAFCDDLEVDCYRRLVE